MIFIGEYNELKVDRKVEFGYYLIDGEGNDVLIPNGSLNGKEIKEGEKIEVLYIEIAKIDQ